MKSNIQRVFRKRMMMGLLAILFIVGSVCVVNVNGSHALANNTVTSITLAKGIDYKLEKHSDIREYRKNGVLTAPKLSDASIADKWIFAGWYQDEACKKVLSSSAVSGEAYAKFVPVDVLSVKCQISADTTPESTGTLIRCISSVDSLKYKQIGFEFITPNGTQYMQSKKVGTRINAINEGNDCGYSPKVVDTESEYFFSAVYKMSKKEADAENGIDKEDFDTTYIVKPYWVTSDGTTVYGMSRSISVNEALEKNVIHIPVKMAEAPAKAHTLTANSQTLTYVHYDADSQYAHFALSINSSLDSATKYDIAGSDGNGNSVSTSYIYRNLGTKYNGTNADDSWYEIYNTDDTSEDEYVIVTSADLYGMAGIVNNGNTLKDNTVYVACDIEANKGYADHEALKWDKTKGADGQLLENDEQGTGYYWMRIGNDSNRFAGVFDGQMHTISGIYYDSIQTTPDSQNFHGLFGVVTTSSQIRNLRIENSYYLLSGTNQNSIGSIVGRTYGGQFSTIYSNAVVIGSNYNIGGLVGQYHSSGSNFKLNNCWFDGSVVNNTSKLDRTGGLAGGILSDAVITNCLNTGTISMPNREATPGIGGLVGWIANKNVQFYHCFNTGKVTYNTKATDGFGTIVGNIYSGSASFSDTFYLKNETCLVPVDNTNNDSVTEVNKIEVSGVKALTTDISVLFSYITDEITKANESYWAIVNGGTPVLASFKEYAKVDGKTAGAMAVDTSWHNTVDTEFVLSDAADLYGLSLLSQEDPFTGKEFTLSKNITINQGTPYGEDGVADADDEETPDDWSKVAPEYEWIGIGCEAHPFSGEFNGNMKTISGVYFNSSESYVGLFNYTDSDATIKNLKLTDSYFFTAKGGIGSIVGKGDGTFDTIYSNAIVDGTTCWIGGLVGLTATTPGVTMNNCWFDGEVTQNGVGHSRELANTGGLVGIVNGNSSFTNCLNTGDVTAEHTKTTTPGVAGLVGRVSNPGTITVKNSLNTGKVSAAPGATNNYGPIVGVGNAARIVATDTYAVTDETGEKSIWPAGVTKVTSTSINGTGALKNMKNLFTTPTDEDSYDSCWAVVLNDTPVLEAFAEVPGKECLTIDTSWYNGKGNYTLKDVADLYGFTMLSSRIDFKGETISLSKDIDRIVINEGIPYGGDGKVGGGDDWEPKYEWIGVGSTAKPFAGTFNGNMKSIEGAYWKGGTFAGLFTAITEGSVIQNLSLKNSHMDSVSVNSGSIVGRAYGGTIDTVYSDADIIGNDMNIGGLLGQVPGTSATGIVKLNNCWFAGSVTNKTSTQQGTGGLIGTILNDAHVTNCLNTGAISMPDYTKNTSTTDEIQVKPCIGGFVGNIAAEVEENDGKRETNVLFSYCFNAGVITYNSAVTTGFGTFAGYTPKTSLCFENSYSTIENGLSSYAKDCSGQILSNQDRFYKKEVFEAKAFDRAKALFTAKEDENYRCYWAIVSQGTPVLSSFAENAGKDFIAIDTSWYDVNKNSYTLNDAGDLYGFALLSNEATVDGYKGKTITLGNDITINEGTPYGANGVVGGGDDWADVAPQYEWLSICGDKNHRFAGNFEGNGKTINGLYLNETNTARGFFGWTEKGAVVRNFSIVNSLFNNTAQAIGSVAGNARGSFDAIYSNAIVIGAFSNVGGLIGQISGEQVEITNCWFDGTVTNNSAEQKSTGGLVGAANVSLIMQNCLNTGIVSAPNYTKPDDDNITEIKPWVGGLIGHATPTADITVQHCLNTGKILFNSVATAGFGSIIGRIVNLPADQTLGEIVVDNTYATSQSCWETVSTNNEGVVVSVKVVDGNTIGGDNAKDEDKLGGLFDATLTTKWVVSAKHPVLEVFEKYAPTEKNVTALHQWVTSSASLTATLQNPVTLPNPEGYTNEEIRRQGGYTDGEYFYQAYITYTDPGDEDQNIPAESRNRVKVLKYDLTTGEPVWSKTEMELTHANDITYNSTLECFVVCHGSPNASKISYLKITEDDIVLEETVTLDGINIYDITYNETKDVYVAMGDNYKFYVLNSNFQKISQGVTVASDLKKNAWQGVTCDDDYIYFVLAENTQYNVFTRLIVVYDWSGKQVSRVTLDIKTSSTTFEPENISVVGNKIYIMVAELTANSKPANVYTIDLTKAE